MKGGKEGEEGEKEEREEGEEEEGEGEETAEEAAEREKWEMIQKSRYHPTRTQRRVGVKNLGRWSGIFGRK